MPNPDKELFRIKPLEWEAMIDNGVGPGFRAIAGSHIISVFKWPWKDTWMWTAGDKSCQPCASPEEGKELAEAHWQSYIKQALVAVERSK